MKTKIEQFREFNRFYTAIIGLLDKSYLDSQLSLIEARILFELNAAPNGIMAKALIALLNIDKGYLSRILNQFNKKQLIAKGKDQIDGRAVLLQLTAKGRKLFELIDASAEEQASAMLETIPKQNLNPLLVHMKEIRRIFDKKSAAKPLLDEIKIRTELRSGDIGYVTFMHGQLYREEYGYGISFEAYVANGLYEFYKNYDRELDRVWVAEHQDKIIGFMLLMHREPGEAQLRYFIIDPAYRGIGLGKKLSMLYLAFLQEKNYQTSYLWTTHELFTAANIYRKMGFVLSEEINSESFDKPLKEQRYDLVVRNNLVS